MTDKSVQRLRELAEQVREIAELPVQKENIKLWKAVNDLHMVRPVLHTRDLSTEVLAYEDELTTQIEDKFLQKLELDLLARIYEWKHLRLDRVIEPTIRCQCVIHDTGFGLPTARDLAQAGNKKSAYFESSIFTMDDIEKIQTPRVSYDSETTMKNYNRMKEIFDGILEVKLFGRNRFRHVPWDDLLTWMGIEEGMHYFTSKPDMMHAAAKRYVEAITSQVKQYEDLGLLSSNNSFDDIGNNDPGFTEQLPGPTESGVGAKLKDMWGNVTDQIMTCVSPAMSQDFALTYEKRYAENFGLLSYGCCERVDNKIANLREAFPTLRKISVSPYTKLERAMERIGSDYVVCFKPNSSYLMAKEFNSKYFRDELVNVCDLARKYNSNLVINMKSIITLEGDPTRLWKWCDLAQEVIAGYY